MLDPANLFSLEQNVAVVTGGSRGLGREIAEALAGAGADLVITSRNQDDIEAAARSIEEKTGRTVLSVAGDVAEPSHVDRLMKTALQRWGKIDILVNNAGINIRAPIEELTLEDWRAVQRVNSEAVWLCCRAVVPHMKKSGYGRIINIASALGIVGLSERTPYNSSKGAVVLLTRTLAAELGTYGITCNAICPGPFLTPINEAVAGEFDVFIQNAVPMKRWGKLEEIRGPAVFLASRSSSYMTGALLSVDGGWTAASIFPTGKSED